MQAKAVEFPPLDSCTAIADVRVTDARTDKTIDRRAVEGKTAAPAPVTTTSDVTAWVRAGVMDTLKRVGAPMGKTGAPTLRLTIDQINTTENVLHRSGYEGRIVMSADLVGGNGTSCWKDRFDGFAENYGYAGSAENYRETLNHALDRAMIRMLNAPDFRKAVCSCS